jgi:UDP-N-acetylmuramoyl-L-alanyl-D-glutamate--2,6-diaminopimelate ligase
VLAYLVAHGADSVALEVSSHALALGRVDGLVFDVAGFTNLGHDHLDFHGDVAAYETAKQRLFTPEHARHAVVVADGAAGSRIAARSTVPTARLVSVADAPRPLPDGTVWTASNVTPVPSGGWTCQLSLDGAPVVRLQIGLRGRFNVANAALAAAMLLTVGVDAEAVRVGIAGCAVVPGRMEAVDHGQGFVALVDYAHTPEALAAVLSGVRATTKGRVIAVLGCGGDRDAAKRAPMGAVAATQADVVVVTDDNPRTEDPAGIRAEILAGARASSGAATLLEVGDRAAAIGTAVALARAGDTLVVAGKGHEAGQQVGDDMLPFDDRSALAAALDSEGESAP